LENSRRGFCIARSLARERGLVGRDLFREQRKTSTGRMLHPWPQQARQLTPWRGTVAHLGNRGVLCSHSHGESIGVLSMERNPI